MLTGRLLDQTVESALASSPPFRIAVVVRARLPAEHPPRQHLETRMVSITDPDRGAVGIAAGGDGHDVMAVQSGTALVWE